MVRPEWIVDSLKADKLLSMEDYLLERLRGGPGQLMIHAFKDVTAQPLAAEAIYPAARPPPPAGQPTDHSADLSTDQEIASHESDVGAEVDVQHGGVVGAVQAVWDLDAGEQEGGSRTIEGESSLEIGAGQETAGLTSEEDFSFVVSAAKRSKPPLQTPAALSDMEATTRLVDQRTTELGSYRRDELPAPAREQGRLLMTAKRIPGRANFDPEDMRIAQAAAAAARARCDMLKVQLDCNFNLGLLGHPSSQLHPSKTIPCILGCRDLLCESGLALGSCFNV